MQSNYMGTWKGAHYFPFLFIILCLFLLFTIIVGLYYYDKFEETKINEHEQAGSEITNLHIYDGRTRTLLYSRLMKIGEPFVLEYTHSVTNRPVMEFYKVDNELQIALEEMRFDEIGANLPIGPEMIDGTMTEFNVKDEYYQVIYHNRLFDSLPLQVGRIIANHALLFESGERLFLQDILEEGSYIVITLRP